jgi:hypothetical protein
MDAPFIKLNLPTASNTASAYRHYCRNPKCRSKLPEPTSISRNAFCTRGCYVGFYRTRCVVCEEKFERTNEREKVCGRRKCQAAFRRDRPHFLGFRYGGASDVVEASRSAHFTGLKRPLIPGRPWRIIAGPELSLRSFQAATIPLDSATASRIDRVNRGYWAESAKTALIQPHHPPINVLGGYRFPDAPQIDLRLAEPKEPAKALSTLTARIPDDLTIPDFLRRERNEQ